MSHYPFHCYVEAQAQVEGPVTLVPADAPSLGSAPPPEFGGPGGLWSPEDLLVAASVDCFVLTFRAIARASKYTWSRLACKADGRLDHEEGITRFSSITIHATLFIPTGCDPARGEVLLEKAEKKCLVMNSLKLTATLDAQVVTA